MKRIYSRIILSIISLSLVFSICFGAMSCSGSKGGYTEQDLTAVNIDDNYDNYYHVFVYSFADGNNDGMGDLLGVTQRLDYIKDLGFTGIYLSPVHPSDTYHKYDVDDYYAIDEQYGTLQDFDNLVNQAHSKGLKIMMDMVFNHTSDRHEWFKACKSWYTEEYNHTNNNKTETEKYKDYYNISKSDGNTLVGSYKYECGFGGSMPDLNLDSEYVRDEIKNIMEFWLLDHNVDGFRYDACTSFYGFANIDSQDVEFINWLVTTAREIKSGVYQIGEVLVNNMAQLKQYYESGIDSLFYFPISMNNSTSSFFTTTGGVDDTPGSTYTTIMSTADRWINGIKTGSSEYTANSSAILAPLLDNHDTNRSSGALWYDTDRIKITQGMLSLMQGTTFTYYGSEIGMKSRTDGVDNYTRDPFRRLPFKWSNSWEDTNQIDEFKYVGVGIAGERISVNPSTDYVFDGAEEQMADKNSILNYYKRANQIRNAYPQIARSSATKVEGEYSGYVSVFNKTYNGETITIIVNLNKEETETVVLDRATAGYTSGIQNGLYVNSEDKATLSSKNGKDTITLPSYSILILK